MGQFKSRSTTGGPLSRRHMLVAAGAGAAAFAAGRAYGRPQSAGQPLLFTNLRLFDGVAARLHGGRSVLVEGGRITAVLSGADRPTEGVQIIDCGGRTLMPGLIDAHWHSMLCAMSMMELMTADLGLITLAAAAEAERTLMRGFTSIRDLAGPAFSLKRAIDAGLTVGPPYLAVGGHDLPDRRPRRLPHAL